MAYIVHILNILLQRTFRGKSINSLLDYLYCKTADNVFPHKPFLLPTETEIKRKEDDFSG